MICCIVGKGSIGLRHSEILEKFKIKTFFLRRKPNAKCKNEISLQNNNSKKIDFYIIANPSSLHFKTIKELIIFNKPILVEKPFITQKKRSNFIKNFQKIFVLYQMRFDSRINFIKKNLNNNNLLQGDFIWKTFLPNWHKNEDFKKSYAARKKLGGGAIFTMSHEIDTAIYLLGRVNQVIVRRYKNKLNTDVEENVKIYLSHELGHKSSIILNFASKNIIRKFNLKTKNKILFKWNFFKNTLKFNNKIKIFKQNNDSIYKKQLKDIILHIKQKKYEKCRIHLSKILHTQKVINSCIESMNKKKIINVF
jgi:predicted dehydrogenase